MADAFEDDAEPAVTIDEYFDKVEAEELKADLVLGGDEGKVCTYDMGYMKRQAIFSCLTCTPDGNAGVCTACSLSCHDGHEIVELWTKRNFRCDCGNSKFGEFFCKLFPNKDVENVENTYNHNFKGLYCTCRRPYPDPDVEDQEEMIQCIMCEDWFHEKHIGLESPNEIPVDEEGEPAYEDFICKACSTVCSFLRLYPKRIWATTSKSVDVVGKDKGVLKEGPSDLVSEDTENTICLDKEHLMPNAGCESLSGISTFASGEISGSKIRMDDGMTSANSDGTTCVLGVDGVNALPPSEDEPMFLSKGWRDFLCRCGKCVDMYTTKHISYLLIEEDSIAEYENMAKKKREEKMHQDGDESSFLDKLGHVEKMEVLHGIADLKDEFRSFLESSDPSKTITASDVHKMFENLAKKRQRLQ